MVDLEYFEHVKRLWNSDKGWIVGDDIFVAHKLMFHWALLVNPNEHGYEHRYCYQTLNVMEKAMTIYIATGELKLWKKDHTNNISVKGKYLYESGMLQEPEYAIGEVDWEIS